MSEADELAASWLVAAEQDLVAARATLARRETFVSRHVCFTAQQAAEKAIKALAIVAQTEFPFVHDLPQLSAVLPPASRPSSPDADLDWLTGRATAWRYPGDVEANWHDAERSVAIAGVVVVDAREKLPSA